MKGKSGQELKQSLEAETEAEATEEHYLLVCAHPIFFFLNLNLI